MINSINWDKTTIVTTAVLSFVSLNLESVNLFLSIILKIATLANIIIYVIVNWRRIVIALKRITKKRKK